MECNEIVFDMEDDNDKDQLYKDEIKEKISSMQNSSFRTTNFSIIEYFVKNDFNPFNQEELITLLLKDYRNNPSKYVLANDKGQFKNEKSFKGSINSSISRNKSFVKGPGQNDLSLNLEKTVEYLRAIQYPLNSLYVSNSKSNKRNRRNNNFQSHPKIMNKKEDILNIKEDDDFHKPNKIKDVINGIQTANKVMKKNRNDNHSMNSQNNYNMENTSDEYTNLRKIFFQYEITYNENLSVLEKYLIALTDIEKELAVKRKLIQENLIIMKNKRCDDLTFYRLADIIVTELIINSSSLDKILNIYITNDEYDIYANAKIIVKKFKDEKDGIVNYFQNEIDCFVGNINIC